MASGMARSHRGFAGIVKSSRASNQAGRRRRRERPRPAGCGEDLHARPQRTGRRPARHRGPVTTAPVPDQMVASVPRPATGSTAAAVATSTPASRPGWPRGTTNSSTSAGGPPDPPGRASADADVPAKNLRTTGLEVPVGSVARPYRADPGPSPAGALPFEVKVLRLFDLGRFRGHAFLHVGERSFSLSPAPRCVAPSGAPPANLGSPANGAGSIQRGATPTPPRTLRPSAGPAAPPISPVRPGLGRPSRL